MSDTPVQIQDLPAADDVLTEAPPTPAAPSALDALRAAPSLDAALAALPGDFTVIVALRDGFKDEQGVYRAKWQPAVVTLAFARRMAMADRLIRPIDELRTFLSHTASKVELRNCCRHAGVPFDGSAQRDDFAARLVAHLDKSVSAAVIAYLAPPSDQEGEDKASDQDEQADQAKPRSSRKSSKVRAPVQVEGSVKPPVQIESV